ncbi:WGxxGxxG family protein [Paenibacillus lactis]|uniref:WGxxGxxG family protein n=1 Tax=Paenibacillus TaxID=44249 RepID=UPI0028CB815F|nr:WGxxGxxG family protein [Paenibacillus sp. IHBB 10380]
MFSCFCPKNNPLCKGQHNSFLAGLSLALVLAVPAFANNNNMNTNDVNANNVNTNSYNANATRDNDTDWGWLGLIGLAGLAGLRRRNPERQ